MSKNPLASMLAAMLMIAIIAPSAFLAAPQKAQAQYAVVEVGANLATNIKTTVESTFTAIKSAITSVASVTSATAAVAMQVNQYVLQPLAFIMSGNLLKLMTASVIAFVVGQSNGTGAPQFVQSLQVNLQKVGDTHALAYLNRVGQTNSPFAASIASAQRTDYLQRTSAGGFFAANQCTLAKASPNPTAFLAGNWSQGGTGAWFALTTQNQNNPYTLYQSSQNELATIVTGATAARTSELSWGQGFLSWCGSGDGAATGSSQNATNAAQAYQTCQASGNSEAQCQAAYNAYLSAPGVNPGDPCTNSDGTPGAIHTPGSDIKATLDRAQEWMPAKLVQMGNIGPEITGILSNIATVMSTVDFASQLLGGSNSGGLLAVGQTSASNPTSRLTQFASAPGYLGVTNSQLYKNTASLSLSGSDMASRVAEYQAAWGAIATATNAASASVNSLIQACQQNAPGIPGFSTAAAAQVSAAQTALATEIAPVLAQVAAASTTSATALAMVQKIQAELNSGAAGAGGAYAADVQALQTMPPTALDVANAQQQAQSFGDAAASPSGSLSVSASSLVDQMSLISTNAVSLASTVCNPSSSLYVTWNGGN